MVNKELLKFKELMVNAENYIWANPETGWKEVKTNEYLKKEFIRLGYKLDCFENTTGFTTTIDTGRKGRTVAIFAELDSVICRSHPECDKETGAVHACGHSVQTATLLGIAAFFKEKDALDVLSGKIKLCVVPAEEGVEISFRKGLKEKGIIKYYSGKQEFVRRGFLDDVDLAFMVHTTEKENDRVHFHLDFGHNGVIRKISTFKGKASHAANAHEGINALNIASNAISVVNNVRETFQEKDFIRFHSILTKAGDVVNTVPDTVIMESYVRASSTKVIMETNKRINRALASVACAFGGNVNIEDVPGSLPLNDNMELNKVAGEVLESLYGKDGYYQKTTWNTGSTDMGDIACIVPAIHAYVHCAKGTS
ncbi:MAG: amidohydrolase, partial [Clostridia bacterium]|nr:amidohydrolase [Clostridia bacterium]